MPLPLTEQEVFALNNDVMSAFTRMQMGDRLNVLGNPSGGADYYVNSNLSATAGDGSSWQKAFKTLAEAMAASHALIATGLIYWAARNRIYYKGDNNSENLTALAQKTDVFGVGSGGGHRTKATIQGTHTIGAGAFVGCRLINLGFVPASAGHNIFTLPSTTRGIEFHNCRFDAGGGGIAGSAIVATANWFLRIIHCDFVGKYSDAAIEILAGNAQGMDILDNYIEGLNEGIELKTGVLDTDNRIRIERNTIHTALAGIRDTSDKAIVNNNNVITLQAKASGHIVSNTALSQGNRVSASDVDNAVYPANGTL